MLDAIAARRSIRKFKNTPVPRHIIEEIIKAGALAAPPQKILMILLNGATENTVSRIMRLAFFIAILSLL